MESACRQAGRPAFGHQRALAPRPVSLTPGAWAFITPPDRPKSRHLCAMELVGLEPTTSWVRCGERRAHGCRMFGSRQRFQPPGRCGKARCIAVDDRGLCSIWAPEVGWCPIISADAHRPPTCQVAPGGDPLSSSAGRSRDASPARLDPNVDRGLERDLVGPLGSLGPTGLTSLLLACYEQLLVGVGPTDSALPSRTSRTVVVPHRGPVPNASARQPKWRLG